MARFDVAKRMTIVRRNHALEHATISILLNKLERPVRLIGRASSGGFHILGDVPASKIEEAVHEALHRLRRGESHLAISSLCGTNIAVAGLLSGISSVMALSSGPRLSRLPNAVMMSMLAVLASQPVGRLAQKYITTSQDLMATEIVSVQRINGLPFTLHKVKTLHRGRTLGYDLATQSPL